MRLRPLLIAMVAGSLAFDLPDPVSPPVPDASPIARRDTAHSSWGTAFPAQPPRLSLPDRDPSAASIRDAMASGDTERALRLARRYVEANRWGRTRDAAWLLIGLLERERGHHNEASSAFTKVRAAEGPLASFGAYYEAEQDLARGKAAVAIRECERIREAWPDSTHVGECLRIEAMGWASLGERRRALDVAETYDEEHEVGPITEQIELRLAMRLTQTDPPAAIAPLRALAVSHNAPLTGRVAESLLEHLRDEGFEEAVLPDDTASLMSRAVSLRDGGRTEDAWAVWAELERRASDDPRLTRWLDEVAPSFGWRLRNWDFLTAHYERQYEEDADDDLAWRIHRAYGRAGNYEQSMAWVERGREAHGNRGPWRNSEDVQAQAFLLGGQYERATELLDVAGARSGWSARRARFRAAFSAFMSGDAAGAVERLTAVIDEGRSEVSAAHWWRARALEQLEQSEQAEADRVWLRENDALGWYGQLAGAAPARPEHPYARDGRWPGAALPHFEAFPTPIALQEPEPLTGLARTPERQAHPAFQTLRWQALPPAPTRVSNPQVADLAVDLTRPPLSYRPAAIFDPAEASEFAVERADRYADSFPMMQAAVDMASVGLFDQSGPLMARTFEEIEQARRRSYHPGHTAAVRMGTDHSDWRKVFLYTRDHHHAARYTYGMSQRFDDPLEASKVQRLTFPLAYDRFVWEQARDKDLDPYMVLALMRQESVYDPNAISRVGARGAMQIMPRTGHRIADLAADIDYTAADLEDPIAAIGYGVTYLGRLMDRFDHVYPLAIASYNGGPHNVSAWLAGTTSDMPMDAFVEHIPFRETRGYVQSVSAHYAAYLDLYAPEGTHLSIPAQPAGDHPEVVDF